MLKGMPKPRPALFAVPTPPAPTPPPRKPRAPVSAKHPGVTYKAIEPHPTTGARRWLIRWRDPIARTASGKAKSREKVLTGLTLEDVRQWCVAQSQRIAAARTRQYRERERYIASHPEHDPRAPIPAPRAEPVRYSIVEAIGRYMRELASGVDGEDPAARQTMRNYDLNLRDFTAWCQARGLAHLEQLNVDHLQAYRASLVARTKPNGKPYAASSIEEQIKPVRTVLNREIDAGRAPHLVSAVRVALKQKRKRSRAQDIAKRRAGLGGAYRLELHEIKALLLAALDYDRRERRYREETRYPRGNVAIDIAALLLCGTRNEEYSFRKCGDVRHAKGHATLTLIGKGDEPRDIEMRGFSRLGTDVLLTLTHARTPDEWLSENAYRAIGYHLRRISKLYADRGVRAKCTPHDLRATLVTYQQYVTGLDPHRRALRIGGNLQDPYERAGHGRDVAHRVYYDPPADAEPGPTLEAVMQCEREILEVLRAYRAWPYRRTRKESRPPIAASSSGAFLTDDPRVLADALAPHPARQHRRTRLPVPTDVRP